MTENRTGQSFRAQCGHPDNVIVPTSIGPPIRNYNKSGVPLLLTGVGQKAVPAELFDYLALPDPREAEAGYERESVIR